MTTAHVRNGASLRSPVHSLESAERLLAFKAELSHAMQNVEPRLVGQGGQWFVALPDHDPVVWRPKRPGRGVLGRSEPKALAEVSATVLVSFLVGKLSPGCVFDIGAGDGFYSSIAASHARVRPTVHAFEMRPEAFSELCESRLDAYESRMALYNSALSDRHRGEMDVWMVGSKLFEHRPLPTEHREAPGAGLLRALTGDGRQSLRSVLLTVTSIDHLCRSTGASPDLIRIDVAGYELEVLIGARGTLASLKPTVVLELHSEDRLRFGAARRHVVHQLTALGYVAILLTTRHDPKACKAAIVDRFDPLLERDDTLLLVFVHPDRLASHRDADRPSQSSNGLEPR